MHLLPRQSQWIYRTLILLLFVGGIGVGWLWRAASHVPQFYADRLLVAKIEPSQELLQDLDTALNASGSWRIALTEQEVNAWLANDLDQQFPHAVPPYASDPRVRFNDGVAQVACQYIHDELIAILSVNVRLEPMDQPNSLMMTSSDP